MAVIVDRPGGIQRPHGSGHGFMIASIACFVAQGPHDDAGMVPVPHDHANAAVHKLLFPFRVSGQQMIVPQMVDAVTLKVGLIHDIQPVFIAQGKESRVIGIVAGAHGIDIVALHDAHILEHDVHGRIVSERSVRVMAVDALQFYGDTIDIELTVLHFDGDKPGADALKLSRDSAQQGIAVRRFRAPRLSLLDDDLPYRASSDDRNRFRSAQASVRIQERTVNPLQSLCIDLGAQGTVSGLRVIPCLNAHIGDLLFREGEQHDIPEDPAHAPHVLVFQIGAVTVLHHKHTQLIASFVQPLRQVKLGRHMGSFGKAGLKPIDEHIECAVDAFKANAGVSSFKRFRQLEKPSVHAHLVFL